MNKKGFTLIELIVSIVLVGIVLASMIGTLMSLKETYTVLNDDIEARTYSALVSKTINDHIMKNNGIKGYTCVANRCEMILGSFDSNGQNKVMTLEITTSTVKTSPMKDKNTTIGSLMEKATTVKYYGEGYSYYKTIKHYDRHYNDSNKDVETGYKFENIEEKSSLYEGNTPEDLKDYLVNITIKMNNPKYNIEIYSTSQVAKVESENLRLYTLTYNSNGGSTCPNNPKVGADRKPWGELCKPTRPNYGFEGWFIQQDGISVREITASTIALEDITVYAHWDSAKYSCPPGEYLPAGSKTCAECLEDNYCPGITDKYYDKFNDQGIIPCKSGYHSPKGSSVETSCKITCPEGTYLNVANDASCTNCPKGYQKGSHQVSEGQTSRCTLIDPSKPSISGGTTKIYGSANITLTCTTPTEYDNPASVYYSFGYSTTEGGTLGNYSTASNDNTLVISKTAYVGNRYYACRVYAGESGGNSTNTINSDGRTLVKIRNAKITFDKNDGALSGTSPLYTKTGVATFYDGELSSTTASAPTATKTGHDFNGWFTASTNGSKILSNTNAIQSTTVSGYIKSSKWTTTTDKTLYAQFSPHNYTVTFDCNGGSGAPSAATVAYGSKYTLTTSVCSTAKTGYTQDGWNTKSDGSGTNWNTSNTNNWTWNIANDVKLYAKWKANTYTVTYNANGGTGTMSNSTATYNENFVTRQNTFTKTDYKFNGWNEKADGTGTAWRLTGSGIYENGNGTKPWKWTYTKDITLYAQWVEDDVAVPKATIVAYKQSAGTTVSASTWSNQKLKFKIGGTTDSPKGLETTVYYCRDTANTCNPTTTATLNTTFNISNDGKYYIRYKVKGVNGKESTIGSYYAKVDSSTPTASISVVNGVDGTPISNGGYLHDSGYSFRVSAGGSYPSGYVISTCIGSGCTPSSSDALWNGEDATGMTSGPDASGEGVGSATIRYKIVTNAGNSSSIYSFTIREDETDPSCSLSFSSSAVSVSCSDNDAIEICGVSKSSDISSSNSSVAISTGTFYCYAEDKTGNNVTHSKSVSLGYYICTSTSALTTRYSGTCVCSTGSSTYGYQNINVSNSTNSTCNDACKATYCGQCSGYYTGAVAGSLTASTGCSYGEKSSNETYCYFTTTSSSCGKSGFSHNGTRNCNTSSGYTKVGNYCYK